MLFRSHRRIMSSFVNNYQLHLLAKGQSALTGGEFLNCSEAQIEDIKKLIAKIDNELSDVVSLSKAVKELDELLLSHTSGESVEHLYAQVPEPLKGYVELTMDMYHNAGYRLIEPLLYNSTYYKPHLQSVSFGSLEKVEERPFVLSTPRLPDDNHCQFDIQFANKDLDTLFACRTTPIYGHEIKEILEKYNASGGLDWRALFTETPPHRTSTPPTEGVRLKYTGHAGFLIETPNSAILIDPSIASPTPDTRDKMVSFAELPEKIDYICLTHNHQDHISLETLLQLRHKTDLVLAPKNNGGSLADPSVKLLLSQLGFKIMEVEDMELLPFADGSIRAIPFLGEHGDLNIRSKTAWLIESAGQKMFFGADSSNLDPAMYKHIQNTVGDVDLLAIGMECIGAPYTWLYGALYTQTVSRKVKESRRLNGADFEQAVHMIETFSPKQVYIYALGIEPWYKYFMGLDYDDDAEQIIQSDKLIKSCDSKDIPCQRLVERNVITLPTN